MFGFYLTLLVYKEIERVKQHGTKVDKGREGKHVFCGTSFMDFLYELPLWTSVIDLVQT